MQDQRSPEAIKQDSSDSAVLSMMLYDTGPSVWALEDVARELTDEIEADDSIGRLCRAGLLHRWDNYVVVTRAAVRAAELGS
jgi:hypothetical protein